MTKSQFQTPIQLFTRIEKVKKNFRFDMKLTIYRIDPLVVLFYKTKQQNVIFGGFWYFFSLNVKFYLVSLSFEIFFNDLCLFVLFVFFTSWFHFFLELEVSLGIVELLFFLLFAILFIIKYMYIFSII